MKYLGKTALYKRMQELSKQIGCKIPKMKFCEYEHLRGDEWLKFEYYEKDKKGNECYIRVSADIFNSDNDISRHVIRVFVDEFMEGLEVLDGDSIRVAHNNYKFYDNKCEYCSINEPYYWAQGRWIDLQSITEACNG